MTRILLVLAVLAALVPTAAMGGAPAGTGEGVVVPLYHPETGELVCRIVAKKVFPSAADPKVLGASNVEITFHREGKKHVAVADTGTLDAERRNVTLAGNVILTFAHERPIQLATGRLLWFGDLGLATTEAPDDKTTKALARSKTPTVILRKLAEKSKTPVTVTTKGITIKGFGMLVAVSETSAGKVEPGRTDYVLIGGPVQTTITDTDSAWLLGADASPPKANEEPKAKAPDADAPAKQPPSPVVVTCPGPLVLHRQDLTVVYHGSEKGAVRVVQGQRTLVCRALTLAFRTVADATTKQTKPDFEGVAAHGDVRIDSGQDHATADTAAWHHRDGFALLVGAPAVITWDNGNELRAGSIRRKTLRIEVRDPKTGEAREKDVLDWLECSSTPDHPHSVYLRARTPATIIPATPPETPRAPAQAPEDR